MTKFIDISDDQMKELIAEQESGHRGGSGLLRDGCNYPIFSASAGDNFIRVIPFLAESDNGKYDDRKATKGLFCLQIYLNFINNRTIVSPQALNNTLRNPFYEQYAEAMDSGDEHKRQIYKARRRYLMWVLPLSRDYDTITEEDKQNLRPHLWAAPVSVYQSLNAIMRDKKTGAIKSINHPIHGEVAMFTRTGEGIETRYSGFQLGGEFPLWEGLLEHMDYLENILKVPTVEEALNIVKDHSTNGDFPVNQNADKEQQIINKSTDTSDELPVNWSLNGDKKEPEVDKVDAKKPEPEVPAMPIQTDEADNDMAAKIAEMEKKLAEMKKGGAKSA